MWAEFCDIYSPNAEKEEEEIMMLTNLKCPVCGSIFSVGIDIKEKTCTSEKCPKCKTEIGIDINYNEKE